MLCGSGAGSDDCGLEVRAFLAALFFLALVFLSAPHAGAETILCSFDASPNQVYIAPEITLDASDYGEVVVRDAVIAATGTNMLTGRVTQDNASSLTLSWEVRNVRPDPKLFSNGNVLLLVRLTIQKASSRARLFVLESGFWEYRTTGDCRFEP
jgi:hypothetical protein